MIGASIDYGNLLQVGPRNLSDYDRLCLRGDSYGALVVNRLLGKYAEMAREAVVYSAKSGAAAAIPLDSAPLNTPTLWNPMSSNKLVVPLKVTLSAATQPATYIINGFSLSYLAATGSTAATGSLIETFTEIAPVGATLGKSATPTTRFAHAAVSFLATALPAPIMDLGMGQWMTAAGTDGRPYKFVYDFDGALLMPPGTAIVLACAQAASVATYWATFLFAELDVPASWS